MIKERIRTAQILLNTHKRHCVIPASKTKFRQKCFQKQMYSMAYIKHTLKMKSIKWKTLHNMQLANMAKWWLACVLNMNDSEIQLTLLHLSGPSKSFMYPSQLNILWVLVS
jgi:hypothetical protein